MGRGQHIDYSQEIGKVYGKWTILEYVDENEVRCKCQCGTERTVQACALRKGRSTCCGLCYANKFARLWTRYKDVAKRKSLEFALSREEFEALLQSPCAYCGDRPERYTGIDRRDNDQGYTTNNAVPCCSKCNYAKRDLTERQFLDHINRIYKFQHGLP